jgi:phospho-N-acetylmuramoyl-pentapeptide-transferase
MALNILKIFGLSAVTFFIGIALTPILTHFLYKYKVWRKEVRTVSPDGSPTPIYAELHKEGETKVPRMGGILVWTIPLFLIVFIWFLSVLFPTPFFKKINFLSRSQTWLPLFTLVAAALVGLADDILQVFGKGKYVAGGLRFSRRLLLITIIAIIGALWFYFKLEKSAIFIPFVGDFSLGILFVPFFVLVMLATFSGSAIDGLDGLAGGVMASIFGAYGGIAYFQNQIDIAAFCAVLVGAILAFLWFNIPPARFYMGETGMFGLTTVLTVIAFLTNAVIILPVIAFPLVITSLSIIIQLLSKKFLKRKVFLVSPIHHHFEAKGWPAYKVTMRFWVVSIVFAIIGMVIALVGR